MVLRLAGIVCSCFYGPYLYLVITLGSVYLAADFLLLYSLFWKSDDGKPSCDFTNQKVWIMIWQVCNIGAVLGLAVALGWYLWLGFWAMLHVPVHFVVFLIIVTILPVLIYTSFILLALFSYLKEAYIDVRVLYSIMKFDKTILFFSPFLGKGRRMKMNQAWHQGEEEFQSENFLIDLTKRQIELIQRILLDLFVSREEKDIDIIYLVSTSNTGP